jgi:DNA-binding transcriptional ArsR family regulator
MSIALMTVVWRMDIGCTDKMVLLALADAANDEGVTWIALKSRRDDKLDLMKKSSLGQRAVQMALRRLEAAGYLSRVEKPGRGVIYTVTPQGAHEVHPPRGAPDAPGGAPHARGGAPDAPKPSTNHQLTQDSLSPTPTKAAYPEDFEAAWKLYPHHTRRSSKPDSLSQWRKLSPADRASLPAACARYRRLGAEPKGECGAPAMERWLKRGLHLNWVEDAEPAATEGPADTAVIARRLRHYRDTGAWEPTWGPRPGMTDDQTRNEGKAA